MVGLIRGKALTRNRQAFEIRHFHRFFETVDELSQIAGVVIIMLMGFNIKRFNLRFILTLLGLLYLGFGKAQVSDSLKLANTEAARQLMAEKKYVSAFALLEESDPGHKDLEIFKMQYEITMDYNVSVIEYQHFGLKNFEAGDNLDTLDITEEDQNVLVVSFPIHQILDTLLAGDSSNIEVNRIIADFYYRVWTATNGKWLVPESQLLDKMQYHYQFLLRNGESEDVYYYMNGYVYFLDGEMDSAITYLTKAVEVNPEYPDANYTLGLAHYYLKHFSKGIFYGERAAELYANENFKADAYRLIGLGKWQQKNYEGALKAYLESDRLDQKNPSTLKLLLECMLILQHDDRILGINEYFNLAPQNPQIYENLNTIYITHNRRGELLEFYNLRFESHAGDHLVLGNLYFYRARLLIRDDKMAAIQDFSEANKEFSRVYKDNHPVFGIIQKSIRGIKL